MNGHGWMAPWWCPKSVWLPLCSNQTLSLLHCRSMLPHALLCHFPHSFLQTLSFVFSVFFSKFGQLLPIFHLFYVSFLTVYPWWNCLGRLSFPFEWGRGRCESLLPGLSFPFLNFFILPAANLSKKKRGCNVSWSMKKRTSGKRQVSSLHHLYQPFIRQYATLWSGSWHNSRYGDDTKEEETKWIRIKK